MKSNVKTIGIIHRIDFVTRLKIGSFKSINWILSAFFLFSLFFTPPVGSQNQSRSTWIYDDSNKEKTSENGAGVTRSDSTSGMDDNQNGQRKEAQKDNEDNSSKNDPPAHNVNDDQGSENTGSNTSDSASSDPQSQKNVSSRNDQSENQNRVENDPENPDQDDGNGDRSADSHESPDDTTETGNEDSPENNRTDEEDIQKQINDMRHYRNLSMAKIKEYEQARSAYLREQEAKQNEEVWNRADPDRLTFFRKDMQRWIGFELRLALPSDVGLFLFKNTDSLKYLGSFAGKKIEFPMDGSGNEITSSEDIDQVLSEKKGNWILIVKKGARNDLVRFTYNNRSYYITNIYSNGDGYLVLDAEEDMRRSNGIPDFIQWQVKEIFR